ncbi:hypothetical protein QTH11_12925 [Clostridium perfringens]|uniref:hypothetical protein n=1 Tax=Clostridium perfringens TaxID=1502 RepID=UPI0018E480C4|nr:hypothetical protein [Clostridium perfringens]MBI6039503.1 hypothetical protein [Clostridium perfringens]MDK0797008.1 hypothetical protein [Clostridium perfringens]MDM0467346.1 hypothetical protein [Clostridium perfringens]MDM0492195.1 hypothetical protein [Clostridium perfringens]HAT4246739.1 hypothetical protein [Clostridium perfringens]
MKNKKLSLLLIILNFILTITILFSEYIYTSYFSIFNWHENCGTQFLAILIISTPILLILSISYYFLGKKITITHLNKSLPIISLLVFLAPILLDTSLSYALITIGTLLGLILCLSSIILFLKVIFR